MKNDRKFGALLKQAEEAGLEAGNAASPTPMLVGSPTTPFGNDIDPTKTTYFVAGGACGFAWVHVKGNTSFGRWASQSPRSGFRKSEYHGGLIRACHDFGQSMERKEAYCAAYAKVLTEAGVTAYSSSRMD